MAAVVLLPVCLPQGGHLVSINALKGMTLTSSDYLAVTKTENICISTSCNKSACSLSFQSLSQRTLAITVFTRVKLDSNIVKIVSLTTQIWYFMTQLIFNCTFWYNKMHWTRRPQVHLRHFSSWKTHLQLSRVETGGLCSHVMWGEVRRHCTALQLLFKPTVYLIKASGENSWDTVLS